jgi:ATP-dependent helicase Lhr and Lhr-like helicase
MFGPAPATASAAACSTCRRSRRWPWTSSATCATPLAGITRLAESGAVSAVHRALRSRSAPATRRRSERARFLRNPPDILITTPESLFLLLTSRARRLRTVDTVIVDEIHALVPTKRGAGPSPSSTPDAEAARLTRRGPRRGHGAAGPAPGPRAARPSGPGGAVDLAERSTRGCSSSCARTARRCSSSTAAGSPSGWRGALNELAGEPLVRAHHGSLAREQRVRDRGRAQGRAILPALVATSSLELGIDMGAVDLVVQVESPPSVASGLQRIGRAGHQVGAVSRGSSSPSTAATSSPAPPSPRAMRAGDDRADALYPRNPLDVLAQQVVAMAAMDVAGRRAVRARPRAAPVRRALAARVRRRARHAVGPLPVRRVRRAAPAHHLGPPRRHAHRAAGRPAVAANAGTIPDRGLYGVFLGDATGRRRASASSTRRWCSSRASARRSCSAPRPGGSRRSPTTACSSRPRPASRARCRSGTATRPAGRSSSALGDRRSCASSALPRERRGARARARPRPRRARRRNLLAVPRRAARGHRCRARRPHDRRRALPRRARRLARLRALAVRRPRARAVGDGDRRAAARGDSASTSQTMWSDDGIVVRLPGRRTPPPDPALLLPRPRRGRVARRRRSSAARRCSRRASASAPRARCCCRAAVPGQRTPLWQQRKRAADLLRSPRATARSRSCSRPTASACGRLRRAGARRRRSLAGSSRARAPLRRRRRDARRRRSRRRCSSATSRTTCTTATRRSPSAARRRSRSTTLLLRELLGARPSCASCSTRAWSRAPSGPAGTAASGATRRCCEASAIDRSRAAARGGAGRTGRARALPRGLARRRDTGGGPRRAARRRRATAGRAIAASLLESRDPAGACRRLPPRRSSTRSWPRRGDLGGRRAARRARRPVALYLTDHLPQLLPPGARDAGTGPSTSDASRVLEHLARTARASSRAARRRRRRLPAARRWTPCGSLVWRGPRHERHAARPARLPASAARARSAGRAGRRRSARGGSCRPPPRDDGRLVARPRRTPIGRPSLGDGRAEQLLVRHGVVTREVMQVESLPGGFSGVYPVLRRLEEAGRVRRGYFVAGLGAAAVRAAGRRGPAAREP